MPIRSQQQHAYYKAANLEDLSPWVSYETLKWLEDGDIKAAAFQAEMDEIGADQVMGLFQPTQDSDEESSSDDSNRSDADFEGLHGRIRVWTSSRTNVDGIGSRYRGMEGQPSSTVVDPNSPATNDDDDDPPIRIVYIISESWKGYGDLLWASSRHMANTFSDREKCRQLLGPTFRRMEQCQDEKTVHPLSNAKVLELGAGCGLPSLMAMKCGARVVCTDLDDPNRIRSIAEAMYRNWKEMENVPNLDPVIKINGPLARACPFRWGDSSEAVAKCLNNKNVDDDDTGNDNGNDAATSNKFDLICATDCLFMPWLHYDLLKAVEELLDDHGVCLMEFAIHESFSKDEEVWPFVDKATERGFHVEVLDAVQMTPPRKGMPAKQGLINILRLTRQVMTTTKN